MREALENIGCLLKGIVGFVLACLAIAFVALLLLGGLFVFAVNQELNRDPTKNIPVENVFDSIYNDGVERLRQADWLANNNGDPFDLGFWRFRYKDLDDEPGWHGADRTLVYIDIRGNRVIFEWHDYYTIEGSEIGVLYRFTYIPRYRYLYFSETRHREEYPDITAALDAIGIDDDTVRDSAVDGLHVIVNDCIRAFGGDMPFTEDDWGSYKVLDESDLDVFGIGVDRGRTPVYP
jgi:hypothetical protein